MSKMRLPGFTAEVCVNKATGVYSEVLSETLTMSRAVVPTLIREGSGPWEECGDYCVM